MHIAWNDGDPTMSNNGFLTDMPHYLNVTNNFPLLIAVFVLVRSKYIWFTDRAGVNRPELSNPTSP